MDAQIIKDFARQRVAQRGFNADKSYADYREIMIGGKQTRHIQAYNQLWFVVGSVEGVRISSSYGEYDKSNFTANELQHEHADQIEIQNYTRKPVSVAFYQVFLIK